MKYLGSPVDLQLLGFIVFLFGTVVWLIFFHSRKIWKEFKKN